MSVDVLIINLTRFGDLLQSQAVIDDLHEAGYKVGLVCLKNFASALPLLRNLDQAWMFDGAKLLASLDSSWQKAFAEFGGLVAQIQNEAAPRAILNLTPTLPSRLLARMLSKADAKTLGFDLDAYGYSVNHGVWASYFSVAAARRTNSPFNLSDLLRKIALPQGAGKGSFRLAEPENQDWAREFLAAQAAGFAQLPAGYLGFQLGASQDVRRWPVENFRELGQILWEKARLAPVLFGSAAEVDLGEDYAKGASHPFINTIGKTDIPQLAALLKQMRLLATNDTGTMHLAAGQGTPILAFFLATAQPWDTGPLLPGSISLEPALSCHPCAFNQTCKLDHKCRKQISPRTAASCALAQLGYSPLAKDIADARVWRSVQEKDGFTNLALLAGSPSETSLWLGWQRNFWRQLLDSLDAPQGNPDAGGLAQVYAGLAPLANAAELADNLSHASSLLETIADSCSAAATSPKLAQIFLRNCERLQSSLDASAGLGSLGSFWRELRLNQASDLNLFGKQAGVMAVHIRALASALAQ